MNEYKYISDNPNDGVIKLSNSQWISIDGNLPSYREYLEYTYAGGGTDPFRTYDEWHDEAISKLKNHHDSIIISHTNIISSLKKDTKVAKSLRRAADGVADANDTKILDDSDALDDWFDNMESAAEGIEYGEQWLDDISRTEQEFINYDPALVPWPDYPVF